MGPLSSVNFLAVADVQHENGSVFVLYVADDSIVASAVPPEAPQRTAKGFAEAPWVVRRGDVAVHVV